MEQINEGMNERMNEGGKNVILIGYHWLIIICCFPAWGGYVCMYSLACQTRTVPHVRLIQYSC
jgi:hypothetical protein